MKPVVVGVADCKISNDPGAVLVTYALGSCIAVSIYDPLANVGGLLHIMLPQLGPDRTKEEANPFMFADLGIPVLLDQLTKRGAMKKRLIVALAGGANMIDQGGVFNIGKRNHMAVRGLLWKAGLMVAGEAVGGTSTRTVGLEVASGRFWVREDGKPEREIVSAVKK